LLLIITVISIILFIVARKSAEKNIKHTNLGSLQLFWTKHALYSVGSVYVVFIWKIRSLYDHSPIIAILKSYEFDELVIDTT